MKSNTAKTSNPHHRHPGESRDPWDASTDTHGAKPTSSMDSGLRRNDDCGGKVENPELDRLTAAKNYANELNESRLWKIKISYQKRWTASRRAQKRVEIQMTKPWQRSTGPKTDAGKMRTRLNALRSDPGLQAMKHALRLHQHFLRSIHTLIRMRKCNHPDEKSYASYCSRLGIAANHVLMIALLHSGYDFHPITVIPKRSSPSSHGQAG